MESPEIHAPHKAHAGGLKWLEATASIAALVVSFTSIFIAIEHGHTMEKLVTANSLPFLSVYTSSLTPDGKRQLSIAMENFGVGPAHEQSLRVKLHGRYLHSSRDLLTEALGAQEAHAARDKLQVIVNNMPTRFIPARTRQAIFTVDQTPQNAEVWSKLADVVTHDLQLEACYCSVFHECWRTNGVEPEKTKACRRDEATEFTP